MKAIFFSLLGMPSHVTPEYKLKYSDTMLAPFHPILIAATAVAAMASAAAGLIAQSIPAITQQSQEILDDKFLTMMCLSGSLGGGIVSVLLFSTTESRKQQAAKFMVSGLTGMMVTPFLMRYMGWQEVSSIVLFCSGVVALLSWGVLIPTVPWMSGVITSIIQSVIQKKSDSNQKTP